ncbi:MAG TPA: hypothetical protein PKK74_06365 [Candidatus Methanoculleus thermohydrogenotrophicum]|jgi:hypothetical protein|nr:hypothetical protein [Candidatus Methanoculleus thermohydrogenotrophicum]NLM82828.1 hypothetical protein [Candidatus Methanoculleus thermohydrogenotrophicum]HOB18299.1 hypothetical protein [Candidatus Methanoculleus thermohydrogenotrophicum]HPZ38058.1 hypothetical protein [Candidatus Methanoculleus thermohydrogenotrophicum]HQC91511.1 hypothetical protein [Candidatus Methanoculleus thermohydrogenotrophicum]
MNKQILILGLVGVLVLAAGCMGPGGPNPKIVEDSAIKDISLSKGLVYSVNVVIQNDGADGDVTVTAKLIDEEKGFVRDQVSTVVFIPSGETRKVSLTLDGDVARKYRHSVEVN